MEKRTWQLKRGAAVVLVAVGLLGAYTLGSVQPWIAAHASTAASIATPAATSVAPVPAGLPDMSAIVERNAPGQVVVDRPRQARAEHRQAGPHRVG